jgi:hypothetical protein
LPFFSLTSFAQHKTNEGERIDPSPPIPPHRSGLLETGAPAVFLEVSCDDPTHNPFGRFESNVGAPETKPRGMGRPRIVDMGSAGRSVVDFNLHRVGGEKPRRNPWLIRLEEDANGQRQWAKRPEATFK